MGIPSSRVELNHTGDGIGCVKVYLSSIRNDFTGNWKRDKNAGRVLANSRSSFNPYGIVNHSKTVLLFTRVPYPYQGLNSPRYDPVVTIEIRKSKGTG